MVSFYGGRKGRDFDIVANYTSLAEMNSAFNSVEYGKYVILTLDTRNENDQPITQNTVYKRGLSDWEKIAELVLPTDNGERERPYMELQNYAAVQGYIDDYYEDHGSYEGLIYTTGTFTVAGNDYIVGQKNQQSFPTIRYSSYVDNLGVAHLGFQMPIPQIKITSDKVGAITEVEDTPMYKEWKINIPDVAATSVTKLRTLDLATKDPSLIIYDPDTDQPMSFQTLKVILVYNYTNDLDITRTYYAGDYNSIASITLNNGTLTIVDLNGTTYTATDLVGITSVALENSEFVITYSDGDTTNIPIKYPDTIAYDDQTGNLNITYSDTTSDVLYTPNFIEATRIDPENKHLYVYYSNPQYRQTTPAREVDENGWVDLGLISIQTGLLVGQNFTPQEIMEWGHWDALNPERIITYLNFFYPNGIGSRGERHTAYVTDSNGNYLTDDLGQKLITVTYSNPTDGRIATIGEITEAKEFYGFDYGLATWYYLGKISDEDEDDLVPAVIQRIDTGVEADIAASLQVGGIWWGVE